jgi:hypothetical protein
MRQSGVLAFVGLALATLLMGVWQDLALHLKQPGEPVRQD